MIGFEPMAELPGAAFVSAGGYHHHLGLNNWRGQGVPPAPPDAVGLRFWTLLLDGQDELARVRERIEAAGVPAEERDEGLLVRDPSGTAVVLTPRPSRSARLAGRAPDDRAVAHLDHARRALGDGAVVRHEDDREPLVAPEPLDRLHHLVAGGRVEVAGGLVREQHARLVGERTRDRHALLLAARELGGKVVRARRRDPPGEQLVGPPPALARSASRRGRAQPPRSGAP